jgi:lysyl-tRNA synthetase, class II
VSTSEDEQILQRRTHLAQIQQMGLDPYPHRFARDAAISDLVRTHGEKSGPELDEHRIETATSGRVIGIRSFGKANFLVLSDGRSKIQAYIKKDTLSERDFRIFQLLDVGDLVGVQGHLFRTRTHELTIWASRLEFLAKSHLPLPEKWHGLTDVEIRYRQRYLDLIVNPEAREVFEIRSKVLSALRRFLDERGYLEVETPMMQSIAGGALARPFSTHHNALDIDLYLRIAPELYLKRLVVGGIERVYEINRNFRNEGISTRHNPEFTMLEFYQAYSDYQDLMTLTEEMIGATAQSAVGKRDIEYDGEKISLAPPFARVSLRQAVIDAASRKIGTSVVEEDLRNADRARRLAERLGVHVDPRNGAGKITTTLFETLVEESLVQPTFVFDFPTEVSPLSKQRANDPDVVERFELYVGRIEIANGFSELNDPDEQRRRFEQQLAEKARGDQEAHAMDEDYVRALQYGLPPTAGEGVGVDRLVMLLTNSKSIRDVILFPHMRPK